MEARFLILNSDKYCEIREVWLDVYSIHYPQTVTGDEYPGPVCYHRKWNNQRSDLKEDLVDLVKIENS